MCALLIKQKIYNSGCRARPCYTNPLVSIIPGIDEDEPITDPLAFTYEMNRDLATNDTVTLNMEFSVIGQTGTIDWGDGVQEVFDTGGGTSISTSHLFSNSGLNDVKVYTSGGSLLTVILVNGQGGTGNTGGIDVVFEAVVTNLLTLVASNSSISALPATIPTTVTNISLGYNLITTADLSSYPNLTQLVLGENELTSINLTGVVNLETLDVGSNAGLSAMAIPAYTNITALSISGCAFSTASIETFLDGLDSNTLENGLCYAQSQTPPAPIDPGYPAYSNLSSKNWSIDTDV